LQAAPPQPEQRPQNGRAVGSFSAPASTLAGTAQPGYTMAANLTALRAGLAPSILAAGQPNGAAAVPAVASAPAAAVTAPAPAPAAVRAAAAPAGRPNGAAAAPDVASASTVAVAARAPALAASAMASAAPAVVPAARQLPPVEVSAAQAVAAVSSQRTPSRADPVEARAAAAAAAPAFAGGSGRASSGRATSAAPSKQEDGTATQALADGLQQGAAADAVIAPHPAVELASKAPAVAEACALAPAPPSQMDMDDIDVEMSTAPADVAGPSAKPTGAPSLAQQRQTRSKAAAETPDRRAPAGPSGGTAGEATPVKTIAALGTGSPSTPAAAKPSVQGTPLSAGADGVDEPQGRGSVRHRERVMEAINRHQAKVAGLESELQRKQATIDALSNNMRKVIIYPSQACSTQLLVSSDHWCSFDLQGWRGLWSRCRADSGC
jgi:hypothetical protein